MRMQSWRRDHSGMDDDLDFAIDVAAKRTLDAEHELVAEPVESQELVPKAERVHRRAEDLHDLAHDSAVEPTDPET